MLSLHAPPSSREPEVNTVRPARRWRLLALSAVVLAVAGGAWAAAQFASLDDQPVGWVAPVEFSDYNLSAGKSVLYRGDYIRATWDGDLVAENVLPDGTIGSTKWNARMRLLPTATSWDTGRKIFTMNGTTPVPFRPANLSNNQRKQDLGGGTNNAEGDRVLNYIRGDASNEWTTTNTSGTYRWRYSKLGAIVHSRPYYWDHGKDSAGKTIGRVYVGANDGMLHSFDAETGDEVFAYVPSMLMPKLRDLSVNASPPLYRYYVDGPVSIAKVPKSGGGETTLLVGGLGAGGIGLYALDIGNPTPAAETTAAAAALVKWEINDLMNDYKDDLGHTYGAPQIVKLNDGRTVVLVPNGPNSDKGTAKLFVINADTGARIAAITAGAGGNNALGAIAAVDTDGNGTVDFVYAGDLKGSLWKFNFSGTSNSVPTSATELFRPATLRPITAAPSVIAHPQGGYLVNFGTGQTLQPSDATSTTTEYLYGVWDFVLAWGNTVVDQTLTTRSVTNIAGDTVQVRTASSNTVGYTMFGGVRGWRLALTGGERLVAGDTMTDSGRYMVTTGIPGDAAGQNGWYFQVDALTGGAPSTPFFDLDGDRVVNGSDNSDRVVVGSTALVPVAKSLGNGVWSQPVLAQVNRFYDQPFFNTNSNVKVPATTTATTTTTNMQGSGVWGGHFDYDIYYGCTLNGASYRCTSQTHTHAYDDKYGVTGSNFQNASNPVYNLDKPMPSNATRFKILVANTRWSPAATLQVVGRSTTGGIARDVSMQMPLWQWPLSPGGFLSHTAGGEPLTFTRADLQKLIWALPVDSFDAREWIPGSGDVRAGLVPGSTGCVRGNSGGGAGESGPWMNAALTFQFVRDTTPDSAVQPAVQPVDQPAIGGHMLKKDSASQANQIVQYTVFWHNGGCFGQRNWSKSPALQTASSNRVTNPPAGTDDPRGDFVTAGGGQANTTPTSSSRTVTTSTAMYQGVEVFVTRDYADSGFRQVITRKSTGVVMDDTLSSVGETAPGELQTSQRPRIGRLAWKELLR